nr:hypothetical protein [Tanacetum cinerariifolium]
EEGIDYEEVFAPVARIKAIRLFLAYASYMGFMKQKGDILLVQVYVDDIIFGSTNKELYKAFEKLTKDKFQMSSLGELTFFLGLQVKQKDDGIFISQDKYVAKILRKFSLTDGKSASTPIDTKKPLLKDPDGENVDVHIYRYLKGKPYLGLWYPKDSPFNLVAYSDSDYARASLDRKSTTGDAPSCCAQVLWIQNQLLDYGHFITAVSYKLMLFGLTKDVAVHLMLLGHKKKVVVTEDILRQDLRLDDADGVECLPTEEIFAELASSAVICLATGRKFNFSKYIFDSMVRNVDSTSKFLMYPRFFQVLINNQVDDLASHTTKYTSHALTQKVFANMRRIGKGFSGVKTPLFTTMLVQPQAVAEEDDEEDEVHAAPTPPYPTHEPLQPLHEPITSCPQAQPAPPSSPPQEQPTTTFASNMTLLNTLMETCTILSHKVAALEQDKVAQALEIFKLKRRVKRRMHPNRGRIKAIDADEDITLVDMETKVDLDVELQGRIQRKDDDNVAAKEINAAEPTMFDDEEVTMTMDQALIKMKAEKARILNEQMAKRLHDEEVEQAAAREIYLKNVAGYKMANFKSMTYDQVRPIFEREYNKFQTFLKPDRDEEPTKKRVAKESLLQESFKKLIAEVEVSGFESTQETPTIDPKEMSEED